MRRVRVRLPPKKTQMPPTDSLGIQLPDRVKGGPEDLGAELLLGPGGAHGRGHLREGVFRGHEDGVAGRALAQRERQGVGVVDRGDVARPSLPFLSRLLQSREDHDREQVLPRVVLRVGEIGRTSG